MSKCSKSMRIPHATTYFTGLHTVTPHRIYRKNATVFKTFYTPDSGKIRL
jgi:hypothetical protein